MLKLQALCLPVLCRIVTNLQRTLSEHARPSKEMLLQPLPLDLAQGSSGGKEFKRTLSCAVGPGSSTSSSSRADAEHQAPTALPALPALPTGGLPAGLAGPTLPAAFPATPTGAARNMQGPHHPPSQSLLPMTVMVSPSHMDDLWAAVIER